MEDRAYMSKLDPYSDARTSAFIAGVATAVERARFARSCVRAGVYRGKNEPYGQFYSRARIALKLGASGDEKISRTRWGLPVCSRS